MGISGFSNLHLWWTFFYPVGCCPSFSYDGDSAMDVSRIFAHGPRLTPPPASACDEHLASPSDFLCKSCLVFSIPDPTHLTSPESCFHASLPLGGPGFPVRPLFLVIPFRTPSLSRCHIFRCFLRPSANCTCRGIFSVSLYEHFFID